MSAPWFYCEQITSGAVELDERERRHALTVLRLAPPAAITLFDGRGTVAAAELRAGETPDRARRRNVAVSAVISSIDMRARPTPALTIIVAACKGPRLDTLVEKCTELGVDRLVFAHFERSVVRLAPGHADKLRDTAIAACKQSRNAWLPAIETGAALPAVLDAGRGTALLAAHVDRVGASVAVAVRELARSKAPAVFVIGPEGGLAPDEVELLRTLGARFVRLADTVLRVETAAIAVAAHWSAGRLSEG